MRTVFDLLMLAFLFIVLLVVIDKPSNSEMDQAWGEIASNRQQVERARLMANQAYLKAERCQREERDEYPWLREWFIRQAGRDPFRRVR